MSLFVLCRFSTQGKNAEYDEQEALQIKTRIERAVVRHPERISHSIPSKPRDHGLDFDENEYDDDDDDDDDDDEMDSNAFKLRNAAAVGYGNARANTRGNAKFAAQFAALLLRERGYVCHVGDAEEVLGWLESEPFGPPSDELWRRLGMASK